jgi:hypothetical protein
MSPVNYESHIRGRRHIKTLMKGLKVTSNESDEEQTPPKQAPKKGQQQKKEETKFECKVCMESFSFKNQLKNHRKSAPHCNAFNQSADTKLNDLETLNTYLERLGEPPESSKTQAIKKLKKLNINIYDFVEDHPKKFESVKELRRYSLNTNRVFPKNEAKSSALKSFLKVFF